MAEALEKQTGRYRPHIVVLVGGLLVLALAFQGLRGIWQPDEGYYVGTAVTMLEAGDWLVPRLGEGVFLEKPPMMYWGIMGGMRLLGHSEFAVRLFWGLCYAGTAVMVGLLAHSTYGRRRTAILAGIVYATMVVPFIAGGFVTADTPLTLWTTTAIYCFWRSCKPGASRRALWKVLLCGAVGLGFLAKGPAVLVPTGGMFVYLVLRRNLVEYFVTPWALVGAAVFCVVGLSWYVYVSLKVPGAVSYLIDNQIWGRLVSPKYNRNPGLLGALIYLPVLVFGSLPWSSVWWGRGSEVRRTVLNRSWWTALRGRPAALLMLCVFFVPLAILCAASSKLGLYSLPLFAPLAVATARAIEGVPGADSEGFAGRKIALTVCWAAVLLGVRLGLAEYPCRKDARALWAELSPLLTEAEYEIVTVDERADGLLFYGAVEVEHVTRKDRPYPTFSTPERVALEVDDIPEDDHTFLFLLKDDHHVSQVRRELEARSMAFKEAELRYGRVAIIHRVADAGGGTETSPENHVEVSGLER